jgi:hypothetical protein
MDDSARFRSVGDSPVRLDGQTAGAQFALSLDRFDRYFTNGNRALTGCVKTHPTANFSKPSKPPKQSTNTPT